MIIRKSESKRHANSPRCIAYEYDHGDKSVNVAFIEINGRYPEKGRVMNRSCKEIVFVVRGGGKVEIDGEGLAVGKGDSILIKPNQKYFFDGKLDIIASCHPAWHPEQYIACE